MYTGPNYSSGYASSDSNMSSNGSAGIDFTNFVDSGSRRMPGISFGGFDFMGSSAGDELAGYKEDFISLKNIWNGKAHAADYGDIVGATAGAILGEGNPMMIKAGRQLGKLGFTLGNKLLRGIGSLF